MPRIPNEGLIPRADKLIIRAFPKIAQKLGNEIDGLDRAEMDAFLKILPGAIERYQSVAGPSTDLHESVEVAITQLTKSFGSRNAPAVESTTQLGTGNTPAELEETAGGVSDPELPNDSGTGWEGGAQDPGKARSELPESEGG